MLGNKLCLLLVVASLTEGAGVDQSQLKRARWSSAFAGGGTTALTSLIPFFVPLGIRSASGPWSVTTGANVSVIAVGTFP